MLSSNEQVGLQVFVLDVVDREVDAFHASLLVASLDLPELDASLSEIVDCHDVEDARDACLVESLHVPVLQRISADADASLAHLRVEELAQEVAVDFLNMAVDDPDFVPIAPLAGPLSSELAAVGLRRLQLYDPAGLPLVDVILLSVITL